MNSETIFTTFLAAAAFLKEPVQSAAAEAVREIFQAAKYYIRRRLGDSSDAGRALEQAADKPESAARKAVLLEEAAPFALEKDEVLRGLIEQLSAVVPAVPPSASQEVRVAGTNNRVQVAGRDLVVHAAKHVQRNVITPEPHHLNAGERERLRVLIGEVADRLAGDDGEPKLSAVYRMLQRRFGVASYLQIPSDKFEEVVRFLKQQRAIFRGRLLRRNPAAYQSDFFRIVYTGACKLGWERQQVYEFAAKKLALKKPLTSLKQLGPLQLKSLAQALRFEVTRARTKGELHQQAGSASENR